MANLPLPPNASGLFAADEEQAARDAAAQEQADAIAAQQQVPIATSDLVANMQAARPQTAVNLAANQMPPTPAQLAQADINAAETVPAGVVQEPSAVTPQVSNKGPAKLALEESHTSTTDEGKRFAPGDLNRIASTAQQVANANLNLAATEQKAAEARQAAAIKTEEFRTAQVAEQQARDARRSELLQQEEGKLGEIRKDYEAASVDPNHYWKNTSMGGKIGSLVAIALSGLGNAYTAAASPGSNPPTNKAWDIIKGQIDNDIDAQKANIDKQGRAVNSRSNELANLRARLGDDRAAELSLQSMRIDAFKNKLNQEAEKSANPLYQQRAAAINAAADNTLAKNMAELQAHTVKRVDETQTKEALAKSAASQLPVETSDLRKDFTQRQTTAVRTAQLADEIEKTKGKGFGPIAGRLNGIARDMGFNLGEFNALDARRQELFLAQAQSALPGVLSQQDLALLAKSFPQAFTDPVVMVKALRHISDKNAQDAENQRQATTGLMQLPNDTAEYTALRNRRQKKSLMNGSTPQR